MRISIEDNENEASNEAYEEREQKSFSELTSSEKLQYFKDYYLKAVLVGLVIIVALVFIVSAFIKNLHRLEFRAAILNNENISDEQLEQWTQEYKESTKEGKHRVEFVQDFSVSIDDYNQNHSVIETINSVADDYDNLSLYVAADYFDVMITDKTGLDFLLECGYAKSLKPLLSDDEYDSLSPFLFCPDSEDPEFAAAISLKGIKKAEGLTSYTDAYLVIPDLKAKNTGRAKTLIRYLFEL